MSKVWITRDSQLDNGDANLVFTTTDNLFTGDADFRKAFGSISTLEYDMLLLASSIFAADRACQRQERENYQRRIELSIPVVNIAKLMDVRQLIEQILRILSNDAWRIQFRAVAGTEERSMAYGQNEGNILLFSGGLDSLSAAVDLHASVASLALVSHITRNRQTSTAQEELVRRIRGKGVDIPHMPFFVSSKSSDDMDHDQEDSQRTRSFLFLTLASLVARRTGHHEIIFLAENGQMAIHLPLTAGRTGAFSTHTAHPEFLASMQQFVSHILGIHIQISNPYVYKTKAEVIHPLINYAQELIPVSQSCWRNSRLPHGVTHCGECIPCFIRRIAIETHLQVDPTKYATDPWRKGLKLPNDDTGRRNLVDLTEFIYRMKSMPLEEVMNEWPELYSSHFDVQAVIDMYRRFAKEAEQVLSRYSGTKGLLS